MVIKQRRRPPESASFIFFKFGIVFRTVLLYTGIVQDTVGGMYEFTIQKRDPRDVYSKTH